MVQKIHPELRRRYTYRHETNRYRRLLMRMQEDSQYSRSIVQFSFLLLCIWIGIEFYLFVHAMPSTDTMPGFQRPPGVEGFLPISALISLSYWIQTGIINTIHPSGLFILLAILAVSMLLKKAFCSWLCPVGTISESLWRFGQKIFGKNVQLPRWIDYPLRSLKYLLLLFFAAAIASMDVDTLKAFIYSPYNKVADIKMYFFFADIGLTAFMTIFITAMLSVVVKNFWCRYACPYGALLGFISFVSPFKITRNKSTCIDCELCTNACPSSIQVHNVLRVRSDECTGCYQCVAVCPVKDTLMMSASKKGKDTPGWVFGLLVAGVFVAVTGLAMLTGHWHNSISQNEYQTRIQHIDSPLYQHNRGHVPEYSPQD